MSGNFPNGQNNPAGAIPVWVAPGVDGSGFTPKAAAASSITTGGTAVSALVGPINGGYIYNPASAAGQKIATAEDLNFNLVGAAGSGDANGNGSNMTLAPGFGWNIPALAAGVTLSVNAATSSHAFTVFAW